MANAFKIGDAVWYTSKADDKLAANVTEVHQSDGYGSVVKLDIRDGWVKTNYVTPRLEHTNKKQRCESLSESASTDTLPAEKRPASGDTVVSGSNPLGSVRPVVTVSAAGSADMDVDDKVDENPTTLLTKP